MRRCKPLDFGFVQVERAPRLDGGVKGFGEGGRPRPAQHAGDAMPGVNMLGVGGGGHRGLEQVRCVVGGRSGTSVHPGCEVGGVHVDEAARTDTQQAHGDLAALDAGQEELRPEPGQG